MNQARDIMSNRVNGSGVSGGQVQIDGSNVLVVTVPGNEDLTNLARSAQLNFRPVVTSQLQAGLTQQLPPTDGTDAPATGTDAPATGTDAPATGTDAPATGTSSASATVGNAPTTGATAPATGATAPATSPAKSTAAATGSSEAPQGLRAPGAATTTATDEATGSVTTQAESSGPATTGSEVATTEGSEPATTGSEVATTDATGTDAPGTDAQGTDAPGTAAPGTVAWPEGSDSKVPTQPATDDPADWAAWKTAAQASLATLTCADVNAYQGLDRPERPLIACDQDGFYIYVLDATIIPGSEIDSATSGLSSSGSGWTVTLNFKSTGFNTWSNYTANNVGSQVAFALDGEVVSAPTINGPITTVGTEITGNFDQKSAASLANSLKFGALPLAFERGISESVSAELGLEYLTAGLIAGGIGLLLVVIYCLIYYRLLGVITILSLLLSFGLVYAVMVLLGRWIGLSLDMAGVAGLIIAIGITADSFVIYFERLKDEVREGRTFRSAVPRGWQQAKRTILSADAVTFLASAVLYVLAVGEVKGFAFTLGLSTVLDLVVVFLVTHPLVALASGSKIFSSPKWSGLGAVAAAGAERRASQAKLVTKEA